MRRRDFVLGSTSLAGALVSRPDRAAQLCPPPILRVAGGASVFTPCGGTTAAHYATNFPAAEVPISEGGVWSNNGLDWTYVSTTAGFACGTNKGESYDDSYAHLSGFGPDQSVEVVLQVRPGLPHDGITREVELLLRWSDSPHIARGYEIDLSYLGGIEVVRWNGALGDFTVTSGSGSTPVPTTGDVVKATIIGTLISVYYNDSLVCSVNDSTYASGNPGIGFFIRPGASNSDFGIKSFAASTAV